MKLKFTVFVTVAVSMTLMTGCGQRHLQPELGALYDRSAQSGELDRNPVIVIPGVLGSKLAQAETGRVVWGAFEGNYANPQKPDGARLVALPMREGASLESLHDDVVPNGVLDDVRIRLMGLPISLSAYRNILTTLGVGGYRDQEIGEAGNVDYGDEHFTCFQFDYDWRRDNVENAKRLHAFILEKKAYVERELRERGATDPDVRFDIVAHSMGGLVSRYYMRYGDADLPDDGAVPPPTWAGAEHVDRLIMVGTPNAGSADAIQNLVDGAGFAPILPRYDAAILCTMPSVYQLLPRVRHGAVVDDAGASLTDLYDVELWAAMGWGPLDPDQSDVLAQLLPDVPDPAQRRRIALDHVNKCLRRAERFHSALDVPSAPPPGVELHLFAGDAVPTLATIAVVDDGTLVPAGDAAGDGTVPRASALMDERLDGRWEPRLRTPIRWTSVRFLFSDHLGMTMDPIFADNVLFILLEAPSSG